MIIEALLVIVLLGAAITPLLAASGRIKVSSHTTVSAIVVLWLGLAVLIVTTQFVWTPLPANGETAVTNRPIRVLGGEPADSGGRPFAI